ncbi:MAG: hypothetical protein JXB88_16650 [Spirochaetales bacterium]|nr:hypothetical protein [Spirochaetales bacterium]
MQTGFLIIIILFIAFFFYIFIPAIGAFIVRDKWRKFRKRLVEISFYPLIDYSDLTTWKEGIPGNFRFFGNLEAIQGENRIWLNNGSMSIAVDLQDVSLYLIPAQTPYTGYTESYPYEFEKTLPSQEPVSVRWKQIFSLPQGTNIFVAGSLFMEKGSSIFRSSPGNSLLVVIYDGIKKELLKRSIWYGRQKNEYWNQFTLTSLITGFLILLFCTYVFLEIITIRIPAIISLSLSLLPVTLLLPPGVPLFFVYRLFWKKARLLRAERDLLLLPLRYFPGNSVHLNNQTKILTKLPDQSAYVMIKNTPSTSASYIPVEGNVKIRASSINSRYNMKQNGCFLFGKYIKRDNGEYITEPVDPMAELVQIPGNPKLLAKECSKKAKLYAFFSGFCILFEVLLNLFLLIFILQFFIR